LNKKKRVFFLFFFLVYWKKIFIFFLTWSKKKFFMISWRECVLQKYKQLKISIHCVVMILSRERESEGLKEMKWGGMKWSEKKFRLITNIFSNKKKYILPAITFFFVFKEIFWKWLIVYFCSFLFIFIFEN